MKKMIFKTASLLTAAVALASCSSEEDFSYTKSVIESAQNVTLAVANTGDNFATTRGTARPLYSSAAAQNIEKVKVVIYKLQDGLPQGVTTNKELESKMSDFSTTLYGEKTIVAQKVFSPWMKNGVSNAYSDQTTGNGRVASWTLSSTDQIKEEGVYMAYAVGYNEGEYSALATTADFDQLIKTNGTDTGSADAHTAFTFPLTVAQNEKKTDEVVPQVCEIFAGSAPFVVTEKTVTEGDKTTKYYEFNVSLTLHRQVAGTIGYFTNIPVKGNANHANSTGEKLRLVASYRSDNMVFAAFNSAYTGDKGKPSTTGVGYVVNGYDNSSKTQTADAMFYGSSEKDAYTVYEVTLSDWFKGTAGTSVQMDTDNNGLLNKNDAGWTNPLDANNKYPNVQTGTVLGSSFLFPFAMVADKPTLQLQMLDSQGTIIRYWNIRLQTSSSTDSQINKQVTKVAADGTTTTSTDDATKENYINYSILRNHLYNIGMRDNGDGDGGSGGGGGGGESGDEAQDLNNENLILRVNDNWEMIHKLDID